MTTSNPGKRLLRRGALIAMVGGLIATAFSPAQAVTRTQKTFGKWLVACTESDKGDKRCAMSQALPAAAAKQRSPLVVNLNGDKSRQTLVALVPIGVSLPDTPTLGFGGSTTPTGLEYVVCAPRTCVARVIVDSKLLDTLNKNSKGVVNYVMANKKLVQLNVDFSGFKDAYSYWLSQLP